MDGVVLHGLQEWRGRRHRGMETVGGVQDGGVPMGRHWSDDAGAQTDRVMILCEIDAVPEQGVREFRQRTQRGQVSDDDQFAFRPGNRDVDEQVRMGIRGGAAEHGTSEILCQHGIENNHVAGAALELVNGADPDLLMQVGMAKHPVDQFHLGGIRRHDGNDRFHAGGAQRLLGKRDGDTGVIAVVWGAAMIPERRRFGVFRVHEHNRLAGQGAEQRQFFASAHHAIGRVVPEPRFRIEPAGERGDRRMHPVLDPEGHDARVVP